MIKAVIFDFFGVICSDEYWNIIKDNKELAPDFSELSEDVNLGRISWSDFVKDVSERTGKNVEELLAGYASQKLNPQFLDFVEKLHRKYKTAILSNASRETINSLTKDVELERIFTDVIVSSDLGMIKPDARIYEYTLAKLGVRPEEAVFIDDSPGHIYGAREVGMNTVLYHDFGQMKAELVRFLAAGADD